MENTIPNPKGATQQEVHILVGCADARDLNQIQVDGVSNTRRRFLEELNIDVDFFVIRAAGSFITPDVVADIKRIVEKHQREKAIPEVTTSFYVHIQSHGDLTDESSHEYISHVHDLEIIDGSPLNCGMLNAALVGIEIEQLLLEAKPTVNIKGQNVKIDSEIQINYMLQEIYAYDGFLAGDWIKSIDKLRTHPRTQRTILQRAINADPDLRPLLFKITCGLQDYSAHALIRVDEGHPAAPFWDEMQMYIRSHNQNLVVARPLLQRQAEIQKPYAALFCLTDPKLSSRVDAANWYMSRHGCPADTYLPNTVFNMSSSSFDVPLTPCGPYVIAGFFYAVKHLHLTDVMVLGYDEAQTSRMMTKLRLDPIINLIVEHFNVNLIPLNQVDLNQSKSVSL